MAERHLDPLSLPVGTDRRHVVRGGGILAATAALLGTASIARPRGVRAHRDASSLAMDMACDGRTFFWIRAHSDDPASLPLPGDPFVVFGSLYPAGTIDAGLAGPDQAGAIGRWVCRGMFVADIGAGGLPHVVSTVVHMLGDGISATTGALDRAPDGIVTEGVEGGVEVSYRGVLGGYGAYAGLRGEVVQTFRGENDTVIGLTPDVAVPAPNYTFSFTFAED